MRILLCRQFDFTRPHTRLCRGVDRAVCFGLGLLLPAAAILKVTPPSHFSADCPWLGRCMGWFDLFNGATILGLILVLNLFPSVTPLAALVCFLASRRTGCGRCLTGAARAAAWVTFAFDLLAVAMLGWTLRCASTNVCGRRRNWLFRACFASSLFPIFRTGYFVCGVASYWGSRLGTVEGIGRRLGPAISIEPKRMVATIFAGGNYIDIGNRLAQGPWLVILHRQGCSACESLFRKWPPGLASSASRVDLVSASSPPDMRAAPFPVAAWDTRTCNANWIIATPWILRIDNNPVFNFGTPTRSVVVGPHLISAVRACSMSQQHYHNGTSHCRGPPR